jgi:hypothetical protein
VSAGASGVPSHPARPPVARSRLTLLQSSTSGPVNQSERLRGNLVDLYSTEGIALIDGTGGGSEPWPLIARLVHAVLSGRRGGVKAPTRQRLDTGLVGRSADRKMKVNAQPPIPKSRVAARSCLDLSSEAPFPILIVRQPQVSGAMSTRPPSLRPDFPGCQFTHNNHNDRLDRRGQNKPKPSLR